MSNLSRKKPSLFWALYFQSILDIITTSLIGVQPRQGVACQDRIARRKLPFFCSMRPLLGIGIREGPTESRNKGSKGEVLFACQRRARDLSVYALRPSFRCKVRQFIITSLPHSHNPSSLLSLSPPMGARSRGTDCNFRSTCYELTVWRRLQLRRARCLQSI